MRRKTCSSCSFKPTGEGTEERCVRCGAVFPCETSIPACGHTDCEEARGKLDVCPVCKKEIAAEDRFNLYGPDSWIPVHRTCAGEDAFVKQVVGPLPWNGAVGALVKIVDKLDSMYRLQIGDLVEDLVVEKVVDAGRVMVKWIGVVPVTHLQMK